jgi:hypothetical protein
MYLSLPEFGNDNVYLPKLNQVLYPPRFPCVIYRDGYDGYDGYDDYDGYYGHKMCLLLPSKPQQLVFSLFLSFVFGK